MVKPKKIVSVVGARPNFMKVAPLARAIQRHNFAPGKSTGVRFEHLIVHTGQHYDERMSAAFFAELGIPRPDLDLGVGSGSHAEQVGLTMIALEKALSELRPDWVVVVGDVNATCAAAITAKKERLRLAHIESGLRSFDKTMPEEINRLVTDRLADLLFTTDAIADGNLRKEGVSAASIRLVGNIMIDTLEAGRETAKRIALKTILAKNRIAGEEPREASWLADVPFAVVTLHRPANVDDKQTLERLVAFLVQDVARDMRIIWPVHPRAKKRMEEFGLWNEVRNSNAFAVLQPIGYLEMLKLNMEARIFLTDSGGLQEECCVLGTPCLTLRPCTERPVTLEEHGGTCALVGSELERIRGAYDRKHAEPRRPHRPSLWDGHAADRIVEALADED